MTHVNFLIFGHDARQTAVAETLWTDGCTLSFWSKGDRIEQTPFVAVLPMPLYDGERLCIDGLDASELLSLLSGAALTVGGQIPQAFLDRAAERNIRIVDYTRREDFAISNAVTTAEAAIEIAMHERVCELLGAQALVIGFGRIGRLLAHRLAALGVRVTVSARKAEDLAWIHAYGYACADTRALSSLSQYELIFNTVPAPVFGARELDDTRDDALLIDLASAPGGIDRGHATLIGRRVIWALRLPGRYAPYSAARTTVDSITAILSEENYGK